MKKLIWHNEKRIVKDLIPYTDNPRLKLSESRRATLTESLNKFNLVEIPAIDLDNKILAGHQRLSVLIALGRGDEEIDVRVPNRKLTEREFKEYNLRSNVSIGDWDFDLLKVLEPELLLAAGFENVDLSHIFDENLSIEDDDFNVEKAIEKIKEPKTKLGDIIHFEGGHRLICGDSTDPETVGKLIGTDKISMLNFDPIYNIDLDYNRGVSTKGKYGSRKVNDKKTDEEYKAFLKTILQNGLAYANPDCHVFCFCDQSYIGMIQELYKELGIDNKRVCLWIKNNANMTPQVAFNKCFEPVVYGTRGKPYLSPIHNLNEILNKEVGTGNRLTDDIMDILDIWLAKRVAGQDYEHPTQKPPTLYEKAFRRCSKPDDIILDLFGGSGSQLIAAEQLKRRAFLCEIDPVFCDVIVQRYKALTGKEVTYVSSEE